MAERIICLRPHHVDRFVSYYYGFKNMFDNPESFKGRYGEKMMRKLKNFFDWLAVGGTGDEHILIMSKRDTICHMCEKFARGELERSICDEPDSLSFWNGSGKIMNDMNLHEGSLLPIYEFLKRVNQLYPDRKHIGA